jgi:hypothetical protein
MADKKIIAVVGSTGAQGGGLVQAILNDPNGGYAVRAITRDPGKDKAKAIAAKGGEVVKADTDDVESLKKAFAGAYGVFAVTNFWEHFSVDKEQQQARNMAAAAKAAGVKHLIWSTLEDVRKEVPLSDNRMPTLQGKYKCPHFDSKGSIDHVFTESGVPTTFLLASFYWDNFYMFGMGPKKNDDGTYSLTGSSRKAASTSASTSERPASTSRGLAWRPSCRSRWARRSSTTPCRRTCTAASVSRAQKISGTCSSIITTSKGPSAPGVLSTRRASSRADRSRLSASG